MPISHRGANLRNVGKRDRSKGILGAVKVPSMSNSTIFFFIKNPFSYNITYCGWFVKEKQLLF
jgi:hypothetical protein